MLDKDYLRKTVGISIADFDDELSELELAAMKKLELSGICKNKIVKTDSLIVQTVRAYIKAYFRNTPDDIAEKYQTVFEENKNFMRSTKEYTEESESDNG